MRILGIDYGTKRTGLAHTDPLQISVHALDAIDTQELKSYLQNYLLEEEVSKIVIGFPRHKDGTETKLAEDIRGLKNWIEKKNKSIQVVFHDEDYTSMEAKQILIRSGISKKKRTNKYLVDKVSAVLILQDYLKHF